MSITSYEQIPLGGGLTRVIVVSNLAAVVGYHWYLDGLWIASTTAPQFDVHMESTGQGYLEVLDSADPDFDPIASAPASYPARRTLFWIRSVDLTVDYYRVEQQKTTGGEWVLLGVVEDSPTQWSYTYTTDRLDDLTVYTWRIVPVGLGVVLGTSTTIGPETVVRQPDSPDFTATWNASPRTITIAAAA